MKCTKCSAELEAGVTVCPECGEAVCAEKKEKKRGLRKWQLALLIVASVVLLLTLASVIWYSIAGEAGFRFLFPRDNDLYYKDSYSVSDKKAYSQRDTVVATVGDQELTNGVLQIYYWMNVYDFLENYGYYAAYVGLDYKQPLDEQNCQEINGTWQQYFLKDALATWYNYQAMSLMAEKTGMTLEKDMQDRLNNLRQTLATAAVNGGFSSIDAMLQSDMGPGCNYDDYYAYTKVYFTGYRYFSELYSKIDTSDAAINAYFQANEAKLKEQGVTKDSGNLFDVRHILVKVTGGTKGEDGKTTYSDAEWEACREKAQKLLDQWLAGEHTDESFAKLAKEKSEDTGSKENGGLYTDLDKSTSFVKEFVDWYMAEGRKVGDYGLIKTEHGYHVMYCSDIESKWEAACRDGLLSEGSAKILKEASDQYAMEVDYKKIVLGVVDMNK